MENLTNVELQDFLQDFKQNAVVEILEEGKERNEIFEIARARGIQLKGSKDLAGLKLIYTFPDKANKNRARLPKKELLKALPTLIGKPLNIDHDRRYVIGNFIDYRYIVKDNMVVAYAIVYKSNFADEWETAKKLFKAGKLTTSYEIWSDRNKRKLLSDGTYELHDLTMAGGAILFKTKPAFEDAKVLEIAKAQTEQSEELVYASEYKEGDIIIAKDETVWTVPPIETTKVEENKPEIIKIKCANCQHEFTKPIAPITEIKCPECFAILNEKGEILYPPQIIDFNISCPSCSSKNWRLLKRDDKSAEIKCLSCAKKYTIEFSQIQLSELISKIPFLHVGSVSCKQCGNIITYSGSSHMTRYELKCKKCGLTFPHDVTHEQIRKVDKITEITVPIEPTKANEEITSQADELKIDKSAINTEVAKGESEMSVEKKEEIVEQQLTETKAEEAKVEETIKVEATPKPQPEVAETKSETSAVEAKVDDSTEVKFEETVDEDEYEESFETAKRLTYQQKKALSDDDFAVVVTKDDKKIRKFPIHDEAHIRNALARLGQEKVQKTLKELGVSVEDVRKKILRRAKKLGMTQLLERYKATVKKLAQKIKAMRKEKASIIEAMEKKIEFYKANAEEINKRRRELGEAGNNLSDEDILNDKRFSDAKLEKANKDLEQGSIVGTKIYEHDDEWYAQKRKEITDKAEGRIPRKR